MTKDEEVKTSPSQEEILANLYSWANPGYFHHELVTLLLPIAEKITDIAETLKELKRLLEK